MTDDAQLERQARQSARTVGVVLLLIAAWNIYKQRPHLYYSLGGAGGLLLAVSVLSAAASKAFHKGWMTFAVALGWVNSRILLSLMLYLVMTPYGVVMRLFGRDPLNRRGPGAESYWIPRKRQRQPRERFERLF